MAINVLGLPAEVAAYELSALGYTVSFVPCDDAPPDEGNSTRVVRQDISGDTAVLTCGVFKTTV